MTLCCKIACLLIVWFGSIEIIVLCDGITAILQDASLNNILSPVAFLAMLPIVGPSLWWGRFFRTSLFIENYEWLDSHVYVDHLSILVFLTLHLWMVVKWSKSSFILTFLSALFCISQLYW